MVLLKVLQRGVVRGIVESIAERSGSWYCLEYCRDELSVILFKVLQRGVVRQSIQDIAERSGLWYCVFYLNVLSTNMFLKLFKIKKTKHIYDFFYQTKHTYKYKLNKHQHNRSCPAPMS